MSPYLLPSCVSLPPTLPIPPLQAVTKHQADLPVKLYFLKLLLSLAFGIPTIKTFLDVKPGREYSL